jgi:hypothetical protein
MIHLALLRTFKKGFIWVLIPPRQCAIHLVLRKPKPINKERCMFGKRLDSVRISFSEEFLLGLAHENLSDEIFVCVLQDGQRELKRIVKIETSNLKPTHPKTVGERSKNTYDLGQGDQLLVEVYIGPLDHLP